MDKVRKILKDEWAYLTCLISVFYFLPLFVKEFEAKILMFFVLMPAITFACGVIKGIKKGFDLVLIFGTPILFLPSIFIYYNLYAGVFSFVFLGFTLIGNFIGFVFYILFQRKNVKK